MTQNRFSEVAVDQRNQLPFNAFVVVPLPASDAAAPTLLQWVYQQMYERAQQVNRATQVPDLFAIMN